MRSDKELLFLIEAEPKAGVEILAHDQAEATRIGELLKGKHGVKGTTVRVATPDEFVPAMEKARKETD